MSLFYKWVFAACVLSLSVHAEIYQGIDLDKVQAELKGEGLHGWMHAAAHEYNEYVFTYRDPDNFFNYINFSVIPRRPSVIEALKKMHRHDEVVIKGEFNNPTNPQKHIKVTEIRVVQKYEEKGLDHYEHKVKLPDELADKTELVGKVHAVVAGGSVLVIEYKDAVLPVVVENPKFTEELFRNDKIKLQYRIQQSPGRPTHLWLNVEAEKPIEVIDSMVAHHDKKGTIEGYLVKFPKSPQIKFDVYAIQQIDDLGIKREWTIINFEDMELFEALRLKAEKLWNAKADSAVNDRNKYVNYSIKVKATGTLNIISPSQANPQVMPAALDDFTAVE